ncbi:MAG: CoA ester lyase [Caulobacteraceae bacterium]
MTQAQFRPRRSVLFLPASNARALEKVRTLPCDVVAIDLEDASAPELKAASRDAVVAAIAAGGFGRREVVVRVNGLDTPWGEADLKAMSEAGPDAVLVPKIGDAGDVARYDSRLSHAPEKTRLWVMIETARALFHLEGIAASSANTRLACMAIGPNDIGRETGYRLSGAREPLWPAMSMTVAAAHAYGLTALDGVFNSLDDVDGLTRECQQALAFGFDGKTLIHPNQIEPCNNVFTPTPAEIAWAEAVIAAFADPANAGKGVLRVAGKMVEGLHLVQAERLMAAKAAANA